MGDTGGERRHSGHTRKVLNGVADLATLHPDLAAQWHPDNDKTPDRVSCGSHYKAMWVCPTDSRHVWEAQVTKRVNGNGCPVCSGRKVIAGVNDLATTHPEVATQWHPDNRNTPAEVSYGSNKRYMWVCPSGHEWGETPNRRTALNYGCPVCSGKRTIHGVNDLATTDPDLAAEVADDSPLRATEVSRGSKKHLRWRCRVDRSHVWDAAPSDRIRGNGCPVCSGKKVIVGVNDLLTTHPHLAQFWNENNPPMTAVHAGSHSKVKWVCEHGHVTVSEIRHVAIRGQGCGVCSGHRAVCGFNDLASQRPDWSAQWHPDNTLKPTEVTVNHNGKVWWVCEKGHEWFTSPNNRVKGDSGCPTCARNTFTSKGELALAAWVESVSSDDVHRNVRSVVSGHELDIWIPEQSLAIEFNGAYYHSERFRDKDYHRDKFLACEAQGVRLVQVWDHDWRDRRDIIERMLAHVLGESRAPRIGARSTVPQRLESAHAGAFFDANHIRGAVHAATCFGLIHDGEVVAALAVKRSGDTAHISRYATSCTVPGGFSKLVTYADDWAHTRGMSKWETFADLSLSNGDVYVAAGFTRGDDIPPDYGYLYRGTLHHKFLFRKARFKDDPALRYEEGLTERQLAELNNIPRVYDSGKRRYTKAVRGMLM